MEDQTVDEITQNFQQNARPGQRFREICAYLVLGKELFNEMNRNRFTCDENYGEILCTRLCAFIEGLVAISTNPTWPQATADDFYLLINELQEMQYAYEDRFNGFGRDDLAYLCPNEQRNAKGRPKYLRACVSKNRPLTWGSKNEFLRNFYRELHLL